MGTVVSSSRKELFEEENYPSAVTAARAKIRWFYSRCYSYSGVGLNGSAGFK